MKNYEALFKKIEDKGVSLKDKNLIICAFEQESVSAVGLLPLISKVVKRFSKERFEITVKGESYDDPCTCCGHLEAHVNIEIVCKRRDDDFDLLLKKIENFSDDYMVYNDVHFSPAVR